MRRVLPLSLLRWLLKHMNYGKMASSLCRTLSSSLTLSVRVRVCACLCVFVFAKRKAFTTWGSFWLQMICACFRFRRAL